MKNLVLLLITFQVINAGDYPPAEEIIQYPNGVKIVYHKISDSEEDRYYEGYNNPMSKWAVSEERETLYKYQGNKSIRIGEGFWIAPAESIMVAHIFSKREDAVNITEYLKKTYDSQVIHHREVQKIIHQYLSGGNDDSLLQAFKQVNLDGQ